MEDPTSGVVTITCGDGTSVTVNPGTDGTDGQDGTNCTVSDNGSGTKTITCEDGTTATVVDGNNGNDGSDGQNGTSCTVTDDGAGTTTITCEDGTVATVVDGVPGLDAGETRGLASDVTVSAPGNGTHFMAGETIEFTIVFKDKDGRVLDPTKDLTSAALYMNGPKEMILNHTPIDLIGASDDRSKRPHHYIDLLVPSNNLVIGADNSVTFTTNAITNEPAGTYTVGIRATGPANPDRIFDLIDVQIGTATVEGEIVDNCADCHLGADSGQYYMHHVDPGRSAYGSPDIDSMPIQTCRMCHNQEGYAAYTSCADGTRAPCADGVATIRIPDPIIRRVHGVHNGGNLTSAFNVGEDGDFEDYREVHFPADIRNCNKCHSDNSWAEKPTRTACGACHDALNFTTGAIEPPRLGGSCTTNADCASFYTCNTAENVCERASHGGGPQANDNTCSNCHTATAGIGLSPIPDRHVASTLDSPYNIGFSLTAPGNGTHYVAGETPVLTITFTDATTGAAINPATVLTEASYQRAQLFVSGPREHTKPALTNAPNGTYRYVDLRVRNNPTNEDPALSRTATAINYQLADVAGLEAGTYTIMIRARGSNSVAYSWGMHQFQIGTATVEAPTAGNCTSCHEDTRMHGYAPFEPDVCKSCHDYDRGAGNTPDGVTDGWGGSAAPGRSNSGFGAGPLSRRIHGTHFGHYLDKPREVHSSNYAETIIFPQDVRNCTKCHADSKNTNHLDKPQRLACLACHDSDFAIGHATIMTVDPTPNDPWNGDETETCNTCHGGGDAIGGDDDFSVERVHNISDPYRPPYAR